MDYIEAIKDGGRVVHRAWQLVLVQLCMVVISSIGFFILVGIPLAIAFIAFSIDLTGLAIKDILGLLKEPSEIMSKYFWIFLMVISSLFIYILIATMFSIYIFGGSIGVIGRILRDKTLKFNMHIFFSEAKRLFLPVLGFTATIGLILIAIAFFLGITGGAIATLVSFIKTMDSTLALFIGFFFSLIAILLTLILIFSIISISFYGVAAASLKGTGPVRSLKEGINYITRHPQGFLLCSILLIGYIFVSFLLILLGYPFRLIPVIGPTLSFPYQLIHYIFQTYIGLAFISTLFTYYYSTEMLIEQTGESSSTQVTNVD